MSDVVDVLYDYRRQLADWCARRTDESIRAAISSYLGRDDWKPEELKGRLEKFITVGLCDEYRCDGVTLLTVYAPKLARCGNLLTMSQNIAHGPMTSTRTVSTKVSGVSGE